MSLTRFGSVVYLVHRRDSLRASRIMAERTLAHNKIKPVWNSVVTDVLDAAKGKVTGVRLQDINSRPSLCCPAPESSWPSAMFPTRNFSRGSLIWTSMVTSFRAKRAATNIPGVFVAGDCADRIYRQAVTAAGQGCAAAIDVEHFLAARNE